MGEIKSICQGKINLDGCLLLVSGEGLYIRQQMNISKYNEGTHYNHDPSVR
jgi:SsrA-binding protein